MPLLTASSAANDPANIDLHHQFLTCVLPRLSTHAEVCLRHVRCSHERDELRSEMLALGWLWFVRLTEQGKSPEDFPTALAAFAGRAVRAGRRLCGSLGAVDALSPLAQRRHHFAVHPWPDCGIPQNNRLTEALRDNTQTPPDEQAAFRLDFAAWLGTRTDRERFLIDDLMAGERTAAAAAKFGLSAARVSQLRRVFSDDWSRFCGEPEQKPAAAQAPVAAC